MEYRKHFGIYALALDLRQKNSIKLLAVKKLIGPYEGLLDVLGGTPEENETEEQTLIREIKEEIGGVINAESKFYSFEVHAKNTQKENYEFHHFGKLKIITLKDYELPQIRSKDVGGYEWIALNKKEEWNDRISITLKYLLDKFKDEIKMFVHKYYEP